MNEESLWDRISRRYWFQTILFVVLSFVEYITLETFLGGDICSIGLEYSVKNIMLLMGVNLILVSVTRWMRLTFLLSGVFVLILGTANYFVDAFRGYGIVYMDIYAVRTAASLSGVMRCGDTGAFAKVQPSERDCRCRGNGCRRGFFRVDQSWNGFF